MLFLDGSIAMWVSVNSVNIMCVVTLQWLFKYVFPDVRYALDIQIST